ncbi:hypothetical protein STEG23_031642 [Scotinomys teguina]
MLANVELVAVLKRGLQQITGHGGLSGLLKIFFRANDIRLGTLVGEDKYGNKYYEDNKQFFARVAASDRRLLRRARRGRDMQANVELVAVLKHRLQQITGHGGLSGLLKIFFRANVIRLDTLVGEYKYENKDYEENEQFFGSSHVEDSERTLKLIRGEMIAFSVIKLWYKDSSIESRSEEGIGGFMVQFPGTAGPHDISSYFLLSKFFLS